MGWADSDGVSEALVQACMELVSQGTEVRALTVRLIARRADVSPSAISYHFGSIDDLVALVANRLYAKINQRRLELFLQAVECARPEPPRIRDILDALIRPTIGNGAEIRFLGQIGAVLTTGPVGRGLAELDGEMTPHQIIVDSLHAQASWFSRAEIGWRVHAILGIRTHVKRRAARVRALTGGEFDLDDPEVALSLILDIAVPMFSRPQPES